MTRYYVTVQAGVTAFGTGHTPEEARSAALEWIDGPIKEEIPFVEYNCDWDDAAMCARVVVVECSEQFFNNVNEDSTIYQEWDCGWLITEQEADEA